MPPTPDEYRAGVLQLLQQQRGSLTSLIEQVDGTLAYDWQRGMGAAAQLYGPILDQYAKDLAALRAASDDPAARLTLDWLTSKNPQLASIQQSVAASAEKYGQTAAQTITHAQSAATDMAAMDAAQLTQRSLWPAVEGAGVPPSVLFNRPNPDAVAQWVGRAGNGHPLGDLFAGFGQEATQGARQAMMLGLLTGANPKAMASGIANALGISRSRATIISRTEVLGSYRSAAHETYRANADVLDGWIWSAGGANPCFPAGTLITTKRGAVPIEQVKIGDEVLTHTGQYQRVLHVMTRPYTGLLVDVGAADGRAVTSTSEHPFLLERQGQLDWVEASKLRLGGSVVSERQGSAQVFDHSRHDSAVEGRIWQPDDAIALALEVERFACVSSSGASVPVDAINLEHGVESGQIEVHRVTPAADSVFLPILDAQRLEAQARPALWLRLARMATVAARRTKAAARYLSGLLAHHLTAFDAGKRVDRTAARLRAVMPTNGNTHDLAAAGARAQRIVVGDGRATHTGSRAVDTIGTALTDAEGLTASGADLLNTTGVVEARGRAVDAAATPMLHTERLAAEFADALNRGTSDLTALGVRMRLLVEAVTGTRAEPSVAPFVVGWRDAEGDAALLADNFHIQSITHLAYHIQHTGLLVFNLEVAYDNSYVANGFVVHNCAMCMGMDGLQFSLSEELVDHPCGKCAPIPVTKSWGDILGPLGIDASDMPEETSMGAEGAYETGPEKFARMSPEQQRAIIGTKTGYEAYQRGEVELKDFIGTRPAEGGFPAMPYQKSLREMEIPTGRAGSRLVEPAPEFRGSFRANTRGFPVPVDEMPVWARQSQASQAVYQIMRNGLPYNMSAHEMPLLQVNLEQMLKEDLPLNVRLAALREQDVLSQYSAYLEREVNHVTTGASTLGEPSPFEYKASKDLGQALAAARASEKTALEGVQATETAAERTINLLPDPTFRPHGYTYDPEKNLAEVSQRLFGRELSPSEIGSLVGAPDGSYVTYSSGGSALNIKLYGPSWDPANPFNLEQAEYSAERILYLDDDGRLVIGNMTNLVRDDLQGQGLGADIFVDQVRSAAKMGVDEIHTFAAGGGIGTTGFQQGAEVGYYVWPRFGYIGKLPLESRQALRAAADAGEIPQEWAAFKTIQQLMQTQAGRDWWKVNGDSLELAFNLKPNSLSMRLLKQYLSEKGKAF